VSADARLVTGADAPELDAAVGTAASPAGTDTDADVAAAVAELAAAQRPSGGEAEARAARRPLAWTLRLGALALTALVLAAHLGAALAFDDGLDARLLAADGAIVAVVAVVLLLAVERGIRERRRQAVIRALLGALTEPRPIDRTAHELARALVATRMADAALVSVTLAETRAGGQMLPVAAAGYPEGWLAAAAAAALPPVAEVELASAAPAGARRDAGAHPWLAPLMPRLGRRPRVAALPLVRGDELLGTLLLAARRGRLLRDDALRSVVASLAAAALDQARLHHAAEERLRALEQQEERRREFMSAISHEIRTPLTSIRAFAELLTQGLGRGAPRSAGAEAGQEALLASLSHGVERLGELVNDLIDLGRGAEAQRLAIAPLDVRGALRSAESVLRPAVMLRGQSLALELPERPLSALADAGALEQLVMNLLSNANRHTPAGGSIVVRAADAGARVRLEIEDSGPGVLPADRVRIFEPYYRVERRGVAPVPGSGLGLAVARRLAELQGGRVWVTEARSGSGACFCVELDASPVRAVAASERTRG
jgi:signal transduction histidine kinase